MLCSRWFWNCFQVTASCFLTKGRHQVSGGESWLQPSCFQDINGYNASWDRCDRTFKPDLGLDQIKAGHWFHLLKPSSTWPVIVVPRGGANQPISQSAMTSRAHGQRMRCEPLCHEVHLQNHPPWSWYVDCILEIIWFIWHSDSEFMKFQYLMISWTWCYRSASAIEHWIVQCCSLFVQIGYTLI